MLFIIIVIKSINNVIFLFSEPIQAINSLIPVPVPIYVPVPCAAYSFPTFYPVPIPIPIPVPCFIPTTKKSSGKILKHIKVSMYSDQLRAIPEKKLFMVGGEDLFGQGLPTTFFFFLPFYDQSFVFFSATVKVPPPPFPHIFFLEQF